MGTFVNGVDQGEAGSGGDHAVPSQDSTANVNVEDVVGNKTDAAAAGDPEADESLVAKVNQLINVLMGGSGIATWPAAAAPANAVSMSEVLRAIYDRQVGDGTNASTNSILGKRVVKTNGDPTAASVDSIFDVTGQVLITFLYGEATTAISGGTAPETSLQTITDNLLIAASTVITDDEQGTLYVVNGDFATLLSGSTIGPQKTLMNYTGSNNEPIQPFILDGDGIEMLNGGGAVATGGVIKWTLFFIPLEDSATVVASS